MDEKVSVIMPTYNCSAYIADAVQSVRKQSYTNWELWIVDDCSIDETARVLKPFLHDSRIHYFCLSKNGGPAAARNYGLRQASGRYIAFLDSDDVWHPQKLERQVAFMNEMQPEGCHFCCTAYSKITENGKSLHYALVPPKKTGYWKMFLLSDPIGNSTVMYDYVFFGCVQAPLIPKRNDYALWLQMLRGGAICFGMEDTLTRYRVREGSVSYQKTSLIRHQWNLYRNIEKMSLFLSVFGILSWIFVKITKIGCKIRKNKE